MKFLTPLAIFAGLVCAGSIIAYAIFAPQRYEYSGGIGGVNVRIDRLTSRVECLKLEEGDLVYGRPCPQGLFMLRLPDAQPASTQQDAGQGDTGQLTEPLPQTNIPQP